LAATHNEITASLWLQYAWHRHDGPDPVAWRSAADWEAGKQAEARASTELMVEVRRTAPDLEDTIRTLHDQFGTPQCVRDQRARRSPAPSSTWPGWYEPRDMIAIAMGAPEPCRLNGLWWHDREHYPLEGIGSVAELARLKMPDWPRVGCVQRMLDSRERWRQERPDEPPAGFGIIWDNLAVPGRGEVATICYPSYVDLGLYLMGATRFLTILGGEPELADAFMELCFELSISYTEYLLSLRSESFTGLCGFGGDATFFLSPTLYPRYGAAWDARLFAHVCARHRLPTEAPCNLHSCGASAHLYAAWGRHPCHRNITAMQTRLIPGAVGRLRSSLPDVELELTLHPPQFDLVAAEPEATRAILRQSAADAGGRNVHFSVITAAQQPTDLPRVTRNVQAIIDEMTALRSAARPARRPQCAATGAST